MNILLELLAWYQGKGDEYRERTLLTDCVNDFLKQHYEKIEFNADGKSGGLKMGDVSFWKCKKCGYEFNSLLMSIVPDCPRGCGENTLIPVGAGEVFPLEISISDIDPSEGITDMRKLFDR